MVTENSPKIPKKFHCICCDYSCSNKKDFNKHLLTRKHEKMGICDTLVTNGDTESLKIPDSIFQCKKCEKIYKSRNGLWTHQKKCTFAEPDNKIICKLIDQNMELVTQNQEFKQMMVEQNKQNADLQKQLLDLAKEHGDWYQSDCDFIWAYCKYFWESHVQLPEIDIDELEEFIKENRPAPLVQDS